MAVVRALCYMRPGRCLHIQSLDTYSDPSHCCIVLCGQPSITPQGSPGRLQLPTAQTVPLEGTRSHRPGPVGRFLWPVQAGVGCQSQSGPRWLLRTTQRFRGLQQQVPLSVPTLGCPRPGPAAPQVLNTAPGIVPGSRWEPLIRCPSPTGGQCVGAVLEGGPEPHTQVLEGLAHES